MKGEIFHKARMHGVYLQFSLEYWYAKVIQLHKKQFLSLNSSYVFLSGTPLVHLFVLFVSYLYFLTSYYENVMDSILITSFTCAHQNLKLAIILHHWWSKEGVTVLPSDVILFGNRFSLFWSNKIIKWETTSTHYLLHTKAFNWSFLLKR